MTSAELMSIQAVSPLSAVPTAAVLTAGAALAALAGVADVSGPAGVAAVAAGGVGAVACAISGAAHASIGNNNRAIHSHTWRRGCAIRGTCNMKLLLDKSNAGQRPPRLTGATHSKCF